MSVRSVLPCPKSPSGEICTRLNHTMPTFPGSGLHYLDEGSGPPLLMVHGNPTWSFSWRNLVSAFRDRYRVIVPDHVGCGLSDKPSPGQYDFRLASRIADLASLVEQIESRGCDAPGPRLGRGDRHGNGREDPCPIPPLRAIQYGGLPRPSLSPANSRLSHPRPGSDRGSGIQPVCLGCHQDGRRSPPNA